MNKYVNVMIGADPELFLHDGKKYISSIGKIGGSKEVPLKVDKYGTAVQEDNVAVEYNIHPASSKEEFIQNNVRAITYLENKARELKLSLMMDASALFTDEELYSPKALQFGCDPDYNAWTLKQNVSPEINEETYFLRSCGGHIHVGYNNPTKERNVKLIRAMDLFLGVPSIRYDTDNRRRLLYGKPGAYRDKTYGVEYRTLSNFWIRTEGLMGWAYEGAMSAIDFLNSGKDIAIEHEELIHKAIIQTDLSCYEELQQYYAI